MRAWPLTVCDDTSLLGRSSPFFGQGLRQERNANCPVLFSQCSEGGVGDVPTVVDTSLVHRSVNGADENGS